METITLTLRFNRSTKKMHRYDEVETTNNTISLYQLKEDMPTTPPDLIQVSVYD